MRYDFKKLKAARQALRLTKRELAVKAKLGYSTVVAVENGRGPWIKAIRKLEAALKVKV